MKENGDNGKYMAWCINNGLKIYAVRQSNSDVRIAVTKLSKRVWTPRLGAIFYDQNPKQKDPKWWDEIHRLYEHYYKIANDPKYKEQHRKNTNNHVKP